MSNLIPGYASQEGTADYVSKHGSQLGENHYSDFVEDKIKLSSLGIGTFGGVADEATDGNIEKIISTALQNGINVIDTSAHYRYGRSLTAIRAGLLDAMHHGVNRENVFIVSKGGFITFRGGMPQDFEQWFNTEIVQKKLAKKEDLANQVHLLSPEYIDYQINLSRQLIGVETLDGFLVDQPEIHIPLIGKEKTNEKLLAIFTLLEKAVLENRIRNYGISSFNGMRVETDNLLFQSITSLQGLAEKAAKLAGQSDIARHHFKIIELPFNLAMTEGFTRFNQATGQGNVGSTLQAAFQLGVYAMASHTLMKGHLASQTLDGIQASMLRLNNPAQYAMQFARSTPGIGTALVGLSQLSHLKDLLQVAKCTPMDKKHYLNLFEKV